MPKRAWRGCDSRPGRVVAPISVKGGSSTFIVRAIGPSPISTSSR